MEREYDKTIQQHYRKVAADCGLSATSTMADEITRESETQAILQFISESLRLRQARGGSRQVTIVDVGCGNGYTLERLSRIYYEIKFIGIEKSDELRALASSRFSGQDNVVILEGDIRDPAFAAEESGDILICQRVLMNLLNVDDQWSALNNIINVVRSPSTSLSGGTLLFIEGFSRYLTKLNEARAECELPPLPMAHHNLYLRDDFFDTPRLRPFGTEGRLPPANFLSTHYFVARVLHPLLIQKTPAKRNSEFVRFFSEALKENVGDYSPLRLCIFERT
jgi:SAM-dependent methyltransferase